MRQPVAVWTGTQTGPSRSEFIEAHRSHPPEVDMLFLTNCPDSVCGAPAEITDRYPLRSTGGPVLHIKTRCARLHWYLVPDPQQDRVMDAGEVGVAPGIVGR
jgi:hypothetical protein